MPRSIRQEFASLHRALCRAPVRCTVAAARALAGAHRAPATRTCTLAAICCVGGEGRPVLGAGGAGGLGPAAGAASAVPTRRAGGTNVAVEAGAGWAHCR